MSTSNKKTENSATPGIKEICQNKNAFRNYHLSERFEAGIVLTGTEVKSIRNAGVQLTDAYATIEKEQAYLLNLNISPYTHGNRFNHEPTRKRKLLLHKQEIRKLTGAVVEKGFTLVPVKLYWKKGKVKVDLALGKGKNKGDKREDIKRRDAGREMESALKRKR